MAEPPALPDPPEAPRRPREWTVHGESRRDEYYWLRDRDDPAVIDYLEAENRYTEAVTEPLKPLRERLYNEYLARIQETDESVPARMDGYWYYRRTEQGRDYPVFCRRRGDPETAPEEIVLDVNRLAEGRGYFQLGDLEVSPDHRLLAYSEDTEGDERFTLRVLDLDTHRALDDVVPDTAAGAVWAEDGRTLLYTVLDAAHRPYRVYRHRLGDDPGADQPVYQEDDDAFFVAVDKTADRRYLLIECHSNVTSETRIAPADRPDTPFSVTLPRRAGVEYGLEHRRGALYVLTNDQAVDFRLLRASTEAVLEKGWQAPMETLIEHEPGVTLEDFDVFSGHMAVYVRADGIPRVEVHDLASGGRHEIAFDEAVYTTGPGENLEFETRVLRVVYSSPVTPPSVYDYDMATGELALKKRTPVHDYDPSRYVARRMHATAPDGVQVPVTLVHDRDALADGPAPCLLSGYGAYGISQDPVFSVTRISLMARGVVCAIAHVRGGGELGERWKNAGKLEHKTNTFHDFIASAGMLAEAGVTRPDRLAIMGGSAGGMLIGAVLNLRPDICHAAVAQVPFVDVLNTMLDPTLPLTVIEYDEWGNPDEPEVYERIRSYAPYENVAAQRYPHLLVTAGLNDPRVAFWEPAKWVARLREAKTDDNLLLLKTQMGAGHKGASGRYEALDEIAFEDAFLLERLAVDG